MSASDRKTQLSTSDPPDPAPAQRTIDAADIRAFARRDYALVERQKEEHRARQYREQGWRASVQLAHALFEHARQVAPDFPSEQYRAEDLEHHIQLKRLLDRAAHALAVR